MEKTKEERLENAINAALSTIHNLPLEYFEANYIPKPAIDNFLQMIRGEFWEDEKTWRKLNAMIDGMLLLREYTLKKNKEVWNA
jgi:hypothetical protein